MIKVYHPSRKLEGTIDLPSSKSISNRMLLLQKLYEPDLCIENLSDANDTQLLSELLKADKKIVNVQDAGTAYRFMVAYCACTAGEWLIDGSPRLRERPIGGLVDSLRILGADIEYLGEKGQAPLRIRGGDLVAKHEVLDLSEVKSSQFVSAILLISPKIQGDFRVKIKRNMPSMSYVQLTISCMRRMGFSIWKKDNVIEVSKHKKFDGEHFIVEPDWTSFFYWLSMVHLSKESNLFFPQLRLDSMQKERKLLFEVGNRSIHFEEQKGGLRIIKKGDNDVEFPQTMNFSQFPDSSMTFAILFAALKVEKVVLKGLSSLKFKECNREQVLEEFLALLGAKFFNEEKHWKLEADGFSLKENTNFATYEDHRMAMCVAPLGLLEPILVENEEVVRKSYPSFWNDLKMVGFEIDKSE